MSNLNVTVATVPVVLPQGFSSGKLKISVYNKDGSAYQAQDVDSTTATFADVPPGEYYAVVQRLDATGSNLGSSVQSASVVIATFDAPLAVTIIVS